MTAALHHFTEAGSKGLLCYVNAVNFPSPKACLRLGYQRFGTIFAAKLGGRWRCVASPGCARYGFGIVERSVEVQPAPGRPALAWSRK